MCITNMRTPPAFLAHLCVCSDVENTITRLESNWLIQLGASSGTLLAIAYTGVHRLRGSQMLIWSRAPLSWPRRRRNGYFSLLRRI